MVFCSQGSYGALGIGSWVDCFTPTEVWFPDDAWEPNGPKAVCCQGVVEDGEASVKASRSLNQVSNS